MYAAETPETPFDGLNGMWLSALMVPLFWNLIVMPMLTLGLKKP